MKISSFTSIFGRKAIFYFHMLRFEMASDCVEYMSSHIHGTLVSKLNKVFFQKLGVASALINLWVLLLRFLSYDRLDARLEWNFWWVVHRFNTLLEVFGLIWVWQVSSDCLARTEALQFSLILPLLNGRDQLATFKHPPAGIFVVIFEFFCFRSLSAPYLLNAFKACTLVIDSKKLLVIWLHVNPFVRFRELVHLDQSLFLSLSKMRRQIIDDWGLFHALVWN